jgi:hypothetical protein
MKVSAEYYCLLGRHDMLSGRFTDVSEESAASLFRIGFPKTSVSTRLQSSSLAVRNYKNLLMSVLELQLSASQ